MLSVWMPFQQEVCTLPYIFLCTQYNTRIIYFLESHLLYENHSFRCLLMVGASTQIYLFRKLQPALSKSVPIDHARSPAVLWIGWRWFGTNWTYSLSCRFPASNSSEVWVIDVPDNPEETQFLSSVENETTWVATLICCNSYKNLYQNCSNPHLKLGCLFCLFVIMISPKLCIPSCIQSH